MLCTAGSRWLCPCAWVQVVSPLCHPLPTQVYQNCRMLSTSGELLCYCDRRKLEWYVAKGIAERLQGEPPTIRWGVRGRRRSAAALLWVSWPRTLASKRACWLNGRCSPLTACPFTLAVACLFPIQTCCCARPLQAAV